MMSSQVGWSGSKPVVLLALLLAVFGCSSDRHRELRLLEAPEVAKPTPESETLRKQEMQLVRYYDINSAQYLSGDVGNVAYQILTHCQAKVGHPHEGEQCEFLSASVSDTYCEEHLCTGRARLCQAELMRKLVIEPGTVLTVNDSFGNPSIRIEPQSSATNAALMVRAEQVVMSAVNKAANVLDGLLAPSPGAALFGSSSCFGLASATATARGGSPTSFMTIAAGTLVEASQLSELLTFDAADAILASADAELSSTLSPSLANERAITGSTLSRGQAVRALVSETMNIPNVDSGIEGLATNGLCTTSELTAQAQRALEILREAAPPPADVEDADLLIGDFLNTDRDTGSIKQRLVERWGRSLGDRLQENVSLQLKDFADAREYLKQERQVLARSETKTLTPVPGQFSRFASTATLPSDRHPAYWGAAARYGVFEQSSPSLYHPDAGGIGLSFPENRYFTAIQARSFAMRIGNVAASQRHNADQLALLGSSLLDRTFGYVQFTVNPEWLNIEARLDREPFGQAVKLLVVAGEDGLHCATRGAIEDIPCSAEELAEAVVCEPELNYYNAAFCNITQEPTGKRYYFLRSKTGGTRPGDYEALLGASPYTTAKYWSTRTGNLIKSFAIAPDVDQRIAEILKPGKGSCARPKLSCADAEFDERMPLENELSDDGDSVESSWRHYLEMAKSAAGEADQLGQNLIISQLEADTRQETVEMREEGRRQEMEAALADLQDMCGTDVDPMQLLLALSGTTDPKDLSNLRQKGTSGDSVTCSDNTACDGTAGFSCVNGICLKDPLDPSVVLATTTNPTLKQALSRLAECIGKDVSAPFISLGTLPLCVWYPRDIPAQVCKDADPTTPCPAFAKRASETAPWLCDDMKLPNGYTAANTEVKVVDRQLGYFSSKDDSTQVAKVCDDVHLVRNNRGSPVLDRIIATDVFHPYNLRLLAPRIGWTAYFGGGAAVTLDEHVLYTTQSATVKALGWCPECATCTSAEDCADKNAKLDDRLLRAVATIRGTAVGDMRNIHLPFYLVKSDDNWVEKGSWTLNYPGSVSTPLKIAQKEFTDGHTFPPEALDDAPSLYQFSVDTNVTLPPAWRAPDAAGVVQAFASTFSEGGRDYELAIGNSGLYSDYKDYDSLDHRLGWWAGMSTSLLGGHGGNIWHTFLDDEARPPQSRSLLPGGAATIGITVDDCGGGNPCVGSGIVPALCRDPNVASVPGVDDDDSTCLYSVVPIHQPLEYTPSALLDAAELMCLAARDVDDYQCDPNNPPQIQHPRDYLKARAFLDCTARELSRRASLTVFSDFPERAVDALRKESATGSFPALGGTVGQEVSELRSALIQASAIQGKIAFQMRDLGTDFEVLSAALESADLHDEVANVQLNSSAQNQLAQCSVAIAGVGSVEFFGRGMGAAVTCANSFSQIKFATSLNDLAHSESNVARTTAILDFRKRFDDRALTFSGLADDLAEQVELIDSRLANIEKNRAGARRALVRALYKASSAAATEAAITNVGANNAAVARERYQRANRNAIRLAFLAKRAIENRLGVHLSTMNTDLPLVEAPATWEATVCASTGVDYTALKKDVQSFKANTFADQFIGDYVRKLENLVESYRLANDFHEGDDVAVVSLKEDIFDSRADCPTPSRNLLLQSSNLEVGLPGATPAPPWSTACVGASPCVVVRSMVELAPIAEDPELAVAGINELIVNAAGAGVSQQLDLPPGKYRLSWYTHAATPTLTLQTAAGTVVSGSADGSLSVGGGYTRKWRSYDLASGLIGKLVVSAPTTANVNVGAIMLEARSDALVGAYQNTGAAATRLTPSCPDTDGAVFRRTRWTRNCMQLCANGYAEACDGEAAEVQCFREASFAINQRGIENGEFLNGSGFAKGNFNYRLSDVAVNFVGSGVIDCADSANPTSCYGGGNLQYSLVHSGPYFVRNHEGRDARIQLFEGHIEHARGLAIERYLTNPSSAADNELIGQYLRTEFRGRPLDGNFTLRVWETPSIKFDAIEDVQLLLKYRYWTRFQ